MTNPVIPDTAALFEHIKLLETQLVTTTASNNRKEPKVAPPKPFTGKRTESQEFILKCETVFTAQARTYFDDDTKLAYAINLLENEAYEWIKPAVMADIGKKPDYVITWAAFKKEFLKIFSDIDIKELSYQRIQALKQTGSASSYANEFRRYSLNLDWNDEPLRQHFFRGLKTDVKDRVLSPSDFPDLASLIENAIKWDNLLYQRRKDPNNTKSTDRSYANATNRQSSNFNNRSFNPVPTPRPQWNNPPCHTLRSGPAPMEVDSIRGPLMQAEKDRRRQNNLCLYCGSPGHRAAECRKRTNPSSNPSRRSIASINQVQDSKETPQ
jgi:hypothetical protein